MQRLWSQPESRAWHWPERMPPSEWIEKHARIPDNKFNAEPGPVRWQRTPYWREVVDAAADPNVREIWVYKANQVGFTQLMLLLAGYWAAQDPGAVGILMPDEQSIDELFAEQLKPMVEATPELRRLKSGRAWDSTKHELWLTSMPILGLYAGSSSRLEKRPLRYVIGDEINLYRESATEASPIQRLLKRTTTWGHRGKAIFGSKPTTADGAITKGYASCPDKRRYLMPCARCGCYHEWLWSNVRGFMDAPGADKHEKANNVRLTKAAYYECPNCRGHTGERERMLCVEAGRWVSGVLDNDVWRPVQRVSESGVVSGDKPQSERVGFYVWGIVSPWTPMWLLASEFIEAEGDLDKTRAFRNTRQALPWEAVTKTIRPSIVRDKKPLASPPGLVPKWAVALYTTVDTQDDWFVYCIRAWGYGYKSALIQYGEIRKAGDAGFDDLYRVGMQSRFDVDGGGVISPRAMLIDSGGNRTSKVYDFAARDNRIIPTKGMSKDCRRPWFASNTRPGVRLILFDTGYYKNSLWTLLNDADPTRWLPHSQVSEQYCLEMSSEQLVAVKGKETWKHAGVSRNEAWDCEVLQCLAAEMDNLGVNVQAEPEVTPAAGPEPEPRMATGGGSWITSHRGKW